MSEVVLNSDNFAAEVLTKDGVVLVDFFAEWCGPCQMMKPVIAEVAEAGIEGLSVGVIDVDASSDLASEYGVSSIPTFKLFKDGVVVDEWTGAMTQDEIIERVKKA